MHGLGREFPLSSISRGKCDMRTVPITSAVHAGPCERRRGARHQNLGGRQALPRNFLMYSISRKKVTRGWCRLRAPSVQGRSRDDGALAIKTSADARLWQGISSCIAHPGKNVTRGWCRLRAPSVQGRARDDEALAIKTSADARLWQGISSRVAYPGKKVTRGRCRLRAPSVQGRERDDGALAIQTSADA